MTQRWEELQQSHPKLPDLRIYSKGGEDVSAFLEPSPEFVSNHLLIVLPNLLAALEAENPKQIPELARFREGMFAELIELLEYAEELQDQIQRGSSLPIRLGEIEDYMYGVVLIAE